MDPGDRANQLLRRGERGAVSLGAWCDGWASSPSSVLERGQHEVTRWHPSRGFHHFRYKPPHLLLRAYLRGAGDARPGGRGPSPRLHRGGTEYAASSFRGARYRGPWRTAAVPPWAPRPF